MAVDASVLPSFLQDAILAHISTGQATIRINGKEVAKLIPDEYGHIQPVGGFHKNQTFRGELLIRFGGLKQGTPVWVSHKVNGRPIIVKRKE